MWYFNPDACFAFGTRRVLRTGWRLVQMGVAPSPGLAPPMLGYAEMVTLSASSTAFALGGDRLSGPRIVQTQNKAGTFDFAATTDEVSSAPIHVRTISRAQRPGGTGSGRLGALRRLSLLGAVHHPVGPRARSRGNEADTMGMPTRWCDADPGGARG